MVRNGLFNAGALRAPAVASLPFGATGTQVAAHPSSATPLQLLSTESPQVSVFDPMNGAQIPATPLVHAGTLFAHAPSPQVKSPRPSSRAPLQSSSWRLQASPPGMTS